MATTDKTSADAPDLTAIFDNLFIGNLASATTLRDHPELGITHVLSVCPEYPETSPSPNGEPSAGVTQCPTVAQPRHRCIPIQDSEYEDILIHLPSAVAFIKDALDSSQSEATAFKDGETCVQERVDAKPNVTARERSYVASIRKPKVLVHCVMGISRSTTVVCAYLMATRHLSFPAALMLIRRRRPQVHPNYGFRRQLTIFAECDYFTDFPAPVSYHPAHTAWMRKRKREAGRYLTRVGDVVEIKLKDSEDVALSITDDFPTDPAEASCLLSEVEATHFLSISPASLPPLPPSPPSPVVSPVLKSGRRPPVFACPSISSSSSSGSSVNSSPGSAFSSPPSSRSSSFSFAHQLSSLSGPSTAATSVASIPSLLPPSKLRLEASLDDVEPNFLALAGIKHHHVAVPGSSPVDLLVRLNETASFIKRAFGEDEDCNSDSGCSSWDSGSESASETKRRMKDVGQRRHVLIHCTTESRACAVVCAYLMSSRGLTPSQAYNVLEEALPLFNPTKSFLSQLELFHECACNPTPAHPLVRAWLACGPKKSVLGQTPCAATFPTSGSPPPLQRERKVVSTHWKSDSDAEGDADSASLRRKLGTPARCGSFTSPPAQSAHPCQGTNGQPMRTAPPAPPTLEASEAQTAAGVDLAALLQRCEGVGNPAFAFDVEAFRGALRGIAEGGKTAR